MNDIVMLSGAITFEFPTEAAGVSAQVVADRTQAQPFVSHQHQGDPFISS